MEREFDTDLLGENIILIRWSPVAGTIDMRQEAIGTEDNPSIVRMRRVNNIETTFTFRTGAIIVAEQDRIRCNTRDIIDN